MTPKEKADELMLLYFYPNHFKEHLTLKQSKELCLITLEKILNIYKGHDKHPMTKYYEEVKEEINKI